MNREQSNRDRAYRMCLKRGTHLGRCKYNDVEYWVCGRWVWFISAHCAMRWGDYFSFVFWLTYGPHFGFVPTTKNKAHKDEGTDMDIREQSWELRAQRRNELWTKEIERSQQLPESLCAGKVFTICVADGKVLYKVKAVRKAQCCVQLIDGGPDNYRDAVLGMGGWFPRRSIEPLVLGHHRITELFRKK